MTKAHSRLLENCYASSPLITPRPTAASTIATPTGGAIQNITTSSNSSIIAIIHKSKQI